MGWERRERARLQAELEARLRDRLVARWRETVSTTRFEEIVDRLVARQISPNQAVSRLLDGGQSA